MTQEETKELALKSINTLSSLPGQIQIVTDDLINTQLQLSELIQKEDNLKNEVLLEVTNKTDDSGKVLYSNELKRQTAAKEILDVNPVYTKAVQTIKDHKTKIQKINVQLERLRNEFSAAKYILRYLSDAN